MNLVFSKFETFMFPSQTVKVRKITHGEFAKIKQASKAKANKYSFWRKLSNKQNLLADEYYETKSPEVYENLIKAYKIKVNHFVNKYLRNGMEKEDSFQSCYEVIVKIMKKFDPKIGKFSALADTSIVKKLLDLQAKNNLLSIGTTTYNMAVRKIEVTTKKLTEELGRIPTVEEISEESGIALRTVQETSNLNFDSISLDAKLNPSDKNSATVSERLNVDSLESSQPTAFDVSAKHILWEIIYKALDEHCTELESNVFKLTRQGYSYNEIAEILNVSFKCVDNAKGRLFHRKLPKILAEHKNLYEQIRDNYNLIN